jgi:hypothetical protein
MINCFTVVYRDLESEDEAHTLIEHPKASAMSWSHAINDRDKLKEHLDRYVELNASLLKQNIELGRKVIELNNPNRKLDRQ